ncbi:restriction endonuclease [Lysobacter firmicutimachus]|uniref:Restriction endonuclease n=1 Tax=Lysobacter firmicutimachus TaxID=1792846 RepID=A0AAU8MTS6_9GAMM
MGGMIFAPQVLADNLSETAGYKSGLALSLEDLCTHLDSPHDTELILASEASHVRLRSEAYDELFYRLLHRIGHTAEQFNGDIAGVGLYHKYRDEYLVEYLGVLDLFVKIMPKMMARTREAGSKSIDPSPFLEASAKAFGKVGLSIAIEKIEAIDRGQRLSPHTGLRYVEWNSRVPLADIFKGSNKPPELGKFIDQRFIDYLQSHEERLPEMHWRKFEELTAEFFHREGFRVELGPGTNDDGVDVRIWKASDPETSNPHLIAQCKRQKVKVEKVVVKGLYADVTHEGADYGLIVTTSELSPGARTVISTRGYPIKEIDRRGISTWLRKLRTPGTGIVRV